MRSKELIEYKTPQALIENIKAGRPEKYKDPRELAIMIKEYFKWCNSERENPTITGLTLFLGFSDKKSLRDYAEKREFSPLIKTARTIVEHRYEKELLGRYYGGAIFALKNMGWADVHRVDQNIKHEIPEIKIVLSAEKKDELQNKK